MICSLKCSAFSTFSRDGTSGKPGVVQFAAAKKQRLVQETYEPGMTVSLVARRHQVSPSLLFRWRKLDAGGALSAMQADEVVVPASQVQALQQQIKELQRLLGKKTMENEILKEAVEYARGKKVTCAQSAGSCPGEPQDAAHFSEQAICGANGLKPDFYFREEETIVEVALGLPNPSSEFEKDILKAIMAQELGMPVRLLFFISRAGASKKCSQPGRTAMREWALRNHNLAIEIHDLPGEPRKRTRKTRVR